MHLAMRVETPCMSTVHCIALQWCSEVVHQLRYRPTKLQALSLVYMLPGEVNTKRRHFTQLFKLKMFFNKDVFVTDLYFLLLVQMFKLLYFLMFSIFLLYLDISASANLSFYLFKYYLLFKIILTGFTEEGNFYVMDIFPYHNSAGYNNVNLGLNYAAFA